MGATVSALDRTGAGVVRTASGAILPSTVRREGFAMPMGLDPTTVAMLVVAAIALYMYLTPSIGLFGYSR